MDDPRKTNPNRPQQGQQGKPYPRQTPPTGSYNKPGEKRPPRKRYETMSPELAKIEKRKAARKRMIARNAKRVGIILAVIVAISMAISVVCISCINDVLAISVSANDSEGVSVVVEEGMSTNDVIDALDDAGAIKNSIFCKLAAKVIGYNDEGYIAGTYEFNRSMGLENMLNEVKDKSSSSVKTATLTFPEGYNADQILTMLEESNVCSREDIIKAMLNTDFSSDFDFLSSITSRNNRYVLLEGYLFPDTYEFYIGESAESVIKKFLNNFDNKWSDNYKKLADDKGLTVDQVINLASIVEKEAVDADMLTVASILHNRLSANMRLECDSTRIYITSETKGLTAEQIAAYAARYNTYECAALPVGPICNPGVNAIEAVLNAPDTDYYYFIHDSENVFHAAKSLEEQERNIAAYGLAQ